MNSRRAVSVLTQVALTCLTVARSSRAQEAPKVSTSTGGSTLQQGSSNEKPQNAIDQAKENPKRILGIIPNFQTTNDTEAAQKSLTSKEKYSLAWHQMFDVSAHLGNAFQASLQHATNGEPHYGQGWGAYGQRFGAAEADQVTSSFFIFGFFPHILKQDPRYFRKGRGKILKRIIYSASRTVIARTDSGHATFNASLVFGQFAQAGISNLYYPKEDRDISGTVEGWGMNLAYTSIYNLLKEFYPDTVGRIFRRHRKSDNANSSPSATSAPPTP
jgi:hypothetical protein